MTLMATKECPECTGYGQVYEHSSPGWHDDGVQSVTCPRCHGSGQVDEMDTDPAPPPKCEECNADESHPCDANDGDPCASCVRYNAESMADALRSYHWAKPADYREAMIDGGRGHLLRDDE